MIKGSDASRLHILEWPADGRHVLFVHGLSSNARTWSGVARELGRAGYRGVAVDLRGHGRSDKPDHGYEFATMVNDLAAVIDACKLHRPIVVGQSWGGNLAVEFGVRRPDLTSGLVGVDGGTIDLGRRFDTFEACWDLLAPPAFDGVARTAIGEYLRHNHPDWPSESIGAALDNFEHLPDGTVRPHLARVHHREILRSMWEHSPPLQDLSIPLLLMPAVATDQEASTPSTGGATRVIPLAGDHDLHMQQPVNVARRILEAAADGFFS